MFRLRDRIEAGNKLAEELEAAYSAREDVVVLGLPRGGVVVAAEIAKKLGAPLDVVVVRKIGAPMQPELALGAIAEDGVALVDKALVEHLKVPEDYLEREISRQRETLEQRTSLYRRDGLRPPLEGKTCILADDGLATGSTAEAAIASVERQGPSRMVFAVPVASVQGYGRIRDKVDEVVCPHVAEDMGAVGFYYEKFDPVTDEEVIRLLGGA